MNPSVSVIIPCYNEPEDVFRRSLESVIGQTLQDIEIILILDKPDNALLQEIMGEYREKYENIITLTPKKNLGRGEARNLGLILAKGKYIAIHDADDIDFPERLEVQRAYMEENKDISAMISEIEHVDSHGNPVDSPVKRINPERNSFFRIAFNHPTLFVRREVMQKYEGYKDLNYGEDYDLWMRMYLGGEKLGFDDTVLCKYLSPSHSTHEEYLSKMKQWSLAQIQRGFKYSLHPRVRGDIHFHRRNIRALIDYTILTIAPQKYDSFKRMMFTIMNTLRKIF